MRKSIVTILLIIFCVEVHAQEANNCPDEKIYGDANSDNFLEIAEKDKVRRIYFPEIAVRKVDEKNYRIELPEFGKDFNYSSLEFSLVEESFGGPYWKIQLKKSMFYRLECVRIPGNLRTFGRKADSVLINNDQFFLKFKVGDPGNYVKGQFRTNQVISEPDSTALVKGFYFTEESQKEELSFAEVRLNKGKNLLSLQYGASGDDYRNEKISGYSSDESRYEIYDDSFGNYVHLIYKIEKLTPKVLEMKVYDFAHLKDQEAEGYDGFKLSRGKLIAEVYSEDVTFIPELKKLELE